MEEREQNTETPQIRRVGGLEIEQHLDLQRRLWRLQRIGWAVMTLLVLAALIGLTGSGPLSEAWAGAPGGPLRVRYQRFLRREALTTLELHLGRDAAPRQKDGRRRVWISRAYLQNVPFERAVPEPERVEAGPERVTYVFAETASGAPTTITFYGPVTTTGVLEGRIGLPGSPALSFRQFVYP